MPSTRVGKPHEGAASLARYFSLSNGITPAARVSPARRREQFSVPGRLSALTLQVGAGGEHRASGGHVAAHLLDKLVDGGELDLVPDPLGKLDCHMRAVEV